MMKPQVLILHAHGSNRDHEAAQAFRLAGAEAEIVPLNALRAAERRWRDYQLLCIPGGFAYADALGAGKMLALELTTYFAEAVREFVASGKPVIGICNGFQALVKAGLLPSNDRTPTQFVGQAQSAGSANYQATLTFNARGHFECRWVTLAPQSQVCVWTRGLTELIECPVAHGEGNFVLADEAQLDELRAHDQIALTYVRADGAAAHGQYPDNPNGSLADSAGVCNLQGNVLGLMPHPEDHVFAYQHPQHTRGTHGRMGLPLFVNGVKYAMQT
jgi:phosphoribosylformylglycinamidine synthase